MSIDDELRELQTVTEGDRALQLFTDRYELTRLFAKYCQKPGSNSKQYPRLRWRRLPLISRTLNQAIILLCQRYYWILLRNPLVKTSLNTRFMDY